MFSVPLKAFRPLLPLALKVIAAGIEDAEGDAARAGLVDDARTGDSAGGDDHAADIGRTGIGGIKFHRAADGVGADVVIRGGVGDRQSAIGAQHQRAIGSSRAAGGPARIGAAVIEHEIAVALHGHIVAAVLVPGGPDIIGLARACVQDEVAVGLHIEAIIGAGQRHALSGGQSCAIGHHHLEAAGGKGRGSVDLRGDSRRGETALIGEVELVAGAAGHRDAGGRLRPCRGRQRHRERAAVDVRCAGVGIGAGKGQHAAADLAQADGRVAVVYRAGEGRVGVQVADLEHHTAGRVGTHISARAAECAEIVGAGAATHDEAAIAAGQVVRRAGAEGVDIVYPILAASNVI